MALVRGRLWLRVCRTPPVAVGGLLALVAIFLFAAAGVASAESYEEAVEGTSGIAHFWPMGEASGSSFADVVGSDDASVGSGVTLGEPGGLVGDSATAALFDGSSRPASAHAPVDLVWFWHELTVEFWMKWPVVRRQTIALALEFSPNFNENSGGFLVDPDATPGSDFARRRSVEGASRNNAFFAQPQCRCVALLLACDRSRKAPGRPGDRSVCGRQSGVLHTKTESGAEAGNFADSTLVLDVA